MSFLNILYIISVVITVAAVVIAVRLFRRGKRAEYFFLVFALAGGGAVLMRLESMVKDGKSGLAIAISMFFYISIWVALVCTLWLMWKEYKPGPPAEPGRTRRGDLGSRPTGSSFDEEITRDLADIYMQVDEMYQKAKREGRKDVQERLAPLRDSANTAWINQ